MAPSTPDLLHEPLWRAGDLGCPLPPVVHAASVCLPTWQDVIDYEQKLPRVMDRLKSGYPRFFIHPITEELFAEGRRRFARLGGKCHVYPSAATAERALASIHRWTGISGRVVPWEETQTFVLCFPEEADEAARKHWRHAGEGVSSRRADALLQGRACPDHSDAKRQVRERIAQLTGLPVESIFLFPSGMAAIYAAYRATCRLRPRAKSAQFGFAYVDTLKIQQSMGPGVHFFPHGSQGDVIRLSDVLSVEPLSAIFCEFPCNPLLASPDLAALSEIAQRSNTPLVIDETLGTYLNVDVTPVADLIATSLTKYFSGAGDVMAGALIVTPGRAQSDVLRDAIVEQYEDLLFGEDARRLAEVAADFPDRMLRTNESAERVVAFCREHPAVEKVFYPSVTTPEAYQAFARPGAGFGGLFSFIPRDAPRRSPAVFDALRVCKGPNLGTYFSLACPFTLLAHYDELDFVEQCGVSRYLIRVSVGQEDTADLMDRLDDALRVGASS